MSLSGLFGAISILLSAISGAQTLDEQPQVWFTDPTLAVGAPRTGQANIIGGMVEFINRAEVSLDFAMLRLDINPIVNALVAARARGVKVRVITDDNAQRGQYAAYYQRLSDAGIVVRCDRGVAVNVDIHHKFIVRDSKWVWNGDWNASYSDTWYVGHTACTLHSQGLAAQFTEGFNDLFEFRPTGLHKLGTQRQSPVPTPAALANGGSARVHFGYEQDIQEVIASELAQAEMFVDVAHAVLDNQRVAQMLATIASRGVRVRVIYAMPQGWPPHMANLERFGATVARSEKPPCGTKNVLIDGKTIITGSWNCTIDTQHENVMVVKGANRLYDRYAAYFQATLLRCKRMYEYDVVLSPLASSSQTASGAKDARTPPPMPQMKVTQTFARGTSPLTPTVSLLDANGLTSAKKRIALRLKPQAKSTTETYRVAISFSSEHYSLGVYLPGKAHSWVIPPDAYAQGLEKHVLETTLTLPTKLGRYRVDLDIQRHTENGAWEWIANYVLCDPYVAVLPGIQIVDGRSESTDSSGTNARTLIPGKAWKLHHETTMLPAEQGLKFSGPMDNARLVTRGLGLKGFHRLQVEVATPSAYILTLGLQGGAQYGELPVHLLSDGQRHVYEIDLRSVKAWTDLPQIDAVNVRLDFTGRNSVIHRLRFLK